MITNTTNIRNRPITHLAASTASTVTSINGCRSTTALRTLRVVKEYVRPAYGRLKMHPALLFAIIWLGWFISWMAAALWSDRTAKRLLTWDVLVYRILILAGAILSLPLTARHLGLKRIWHVGYTGAYLLAAVTLAGILFAWWARIHLGRLWSSAVTRKEHHHVVDTGPYSLVRHPIYTGLLTSALASIS